jgi:hypothetical protein
LLGKTYKPRQSLPQSMSILYLYAGEDVGALQNVIVDRNPNTPAGTHAIRMFKGGYFPYMLPAGPVRILTTAGDEPACVSLQAQPGLHYWVRISGADTDPRIEVVDRDTGEHEISDHREIGTEARSEANGAYDVPCPQASSPGARITR